MSSSEDSSFTAGERLFLSHLESALGSLGLSISTASPTTLLTQRLTDSLRQKFPVYQRKKLSSLRQQIVTALTSRKQAAATTDGHAPLVEGVSVPEGDDDASERIVEGGKGCDTMIAVEHPAIAGACIAAGKGTAEEVPPAPPAHDASHAAAATANSQPPRKRKRPTDLDAATSSGTGRGGGSSSAAAAAAAFFSGPSATASLPLALKPKERLAEVGGCDSILEELGRLVLYPLLHPEMFTHLGVEPPRGVLLYGPPGVGKTLLARALGGECSEKGVYFRQVEGSDIIAGISGESEARLRMLFDDAARHAPAILFIDEIDSIAPRRGDGGAGGGRGMDRRVLATLASCMDALGSTSVACSEADGGVRVGEELSATEDYPSSTATAGPGLADTIAGAATITGRKGGAGVIVLAATDKPESVDSSLRRAGRFDREIGIPIPDEKGRLQILKMVTQGMRIGEEATSSFSSAASATVPIVAPASTDSLLLDLARATPGFVGADLKAVAKEAALSAISRFLGTPAVAAQGISTTASEAPSAMSIDAGGSVASHAAASAAQHLSSAIFSPSFSQELLKASCFISREDLFGALKKVQPAALREGFATIPNVTWKDVGALSSVRTELDMAILQPLRHPELFKAMGLRAPAGVLLYGPPGCGKTLLAKAIASETHANFISVKGPELLDKYVGESERAVRQLFARARASAPCVVFFDELDALAPRRGGVGTGGGDGGGGGVSERVVNQLLTELDGLDAKRDVFVLAATNRPDIIDPAMLRPGRLEKLLYVPLPTPQDRFDILKTHARHTPMSDDVDLRAVAMDARCQGFSGADLASLVREASTIALQSFLASSAMLSQHDEGAQSGAAPVVLASSLRATMNDFVQAFSKVQPSVSAADERAYASLQGSLRRMRGHVTGNDEERASQTSKKAKLAGSSKDAEADGANEAGRPAAGT